VGIHLAILAVDEDLEFIYREHKFNPAGFRTIDGKELLKSIEEWHSLGYGSGRYGSGTFRPGESDDDIYGSENRRVRRYQHQPVLTNSTDTNGVWQFTRKAAK